MKPHTNTHFPQPQAQMTDITCMDPSRTPLVAEKVCKRVRLMCSFLVQNGVSSKSKVMNDMQVMMKRGKNIGKALNDVVVRHHEALTCRSRDAHVSFVSPMDYQFSCSGSPPRLSQSLPLISKQRRQHGRDSPAHRVVRMCGGVDDDNLAVSSGLKHYSPLRRRVKITGSAASMLSDAAEKDFHVDEAAEEFIERFYRELRLQKWLDHYC